jgi:hypothetical protein
MPSSIRKPTSGPWQPDIFDGAGKVREPGTDHAADIRRAGAEMRDTGSLEGRLDALAAQVEADFSMLTKLLELAERLNRRIQMLECSQDNDRR